MDKILNCIDIFLSELEKEVLEIISDQKTDMTKKNSLIEPLVDQKKIALRAKEDFIALKGKIYKQECGMYKKRAEYGQF